MKVGTLINEQKATVIIEYLAYDPIEDQHKLQDIFTVQKRPDFSKAVKTGRHVYDYVFTDSTIKQVKYEVMDSFGKLMELVK